MTFDYYRKPWFLTLAAFAVWVCGYIMADDTRLENERAQCCWSYTDNFFTHFDKATEKSMERSRDYRR